MTIFTYTNTVAAFVATSLMMNQANEMSKSLELPSTKAITTQDIKYEISYIAVDKKAPTNENNLLTGCIETDQYSFHFRGGYFRGFHMKDISLLSTTNISESYPAGISVLKDTLTTNDVYSTSTNILGKMNVNLERLNSDSKVKIYELNYPRTKERMAEMQVFTITWTKSVPKSRRSSEKMPLNAATLTFDRKSGQLIKCDVANSTTETNSPFSIPPPTRLINIQELLSVPNEEFLKMDATQKSNLLRRFLPPESFPPQKKAEKTDNHGKNQPIKE
jgi:hypothetical protein